jgi:AraC-like DNA-binding protein
MIDFHMHDYYEVSLILTGNVKVLLSDCVQEGTDAKIVLAAPKTPHFISGDSSIIYSRINLLFSEEFIVNYVPEWKQIKSVFGKNGNVIILSEKQKELCKSKLYEIKNETDMFRKRLMILSFLSHVFEIDKKDITKAQELPKYVSGALTYIEEHYAEKIIASELAWKLNIGRTTLMTAFKNYTGSTLNDYVIRCRVKNALILLRNGHTEEETAETCGFSDIGGLIRGFKKCYGMTPKRYLKEGKK